MTHSELNSMRIYFQTLDERDNLYNEVKSMHPDDQRFVLPLYLDDIDHHLIEDLIATWQKENNETDNCQQNQTKRKT